jgi:tRNA-splicing ligase RtcB
MAKRTEQTLRRRDLQGVGLPPDGPAFRVALRVMPRAVRRLGREAALAELRAVVAAPARHVDHAYLGDVARTLVEADTSPAAAFVEREPRAPYRSWCSVPEAGALEQMENALRLPSAVRGALMPDAHRGYGLPIGGVLATEGTVIPYAVGVDIACRMKLTVLDAPVSTIDEDAAGLERALIGETVFGTGAKRRHPADHDVLDAARWDVNRLVRGLRGKGAEQISTSGSGNHFVEFGTLTLAEPDLGLEAGRYLALLSHSGSRGPGRRSRRTSRSWRGPCTRTCRGAGPPGLAGPRLRGGAGVLGRDGADGGLCRRQPSADPRAHRAAPARRRVDRGREPSQLRLA